MSELPTSNITTIIITVIIVATLLLLFRPISISTNCIATKNNHCFDNFENWRTGKCAVRVGHVPNFSPFWIPQSKQFKPSSGYKGLDYDVVEAITRKAQLPRVEYVEFPTLQDLYNALANGKVDILANNLWRTPNRSREFAFTIPYYVKGGIGAMFRHSKKEQYKRIDNLVGKHIGILTGDDDKNWLPQIEYGSIKRYNTPELLFQALMMNDIDVAVEQLTLLKYLSEKTLNSHDVVDSILLVPMQACLVTRISDCKLIHSLNNAINALWEDGTLYKIKSVYLDKLHLEPANYTPYKIV
jgi:ABC-type amino acid transport substrate-binding protein